LTHDSEQPEEEATASNESHELIRRPLVVGVAAGIGDDVALRLLLSGLQNTEELALILCVSHREPVDDPRLLEEIEGETSLPIVPVSDATVILPGHLYLVPANMLVTLNDGVLKGRQSPEPAGERGRIDSLLVSMANELGEHAVAVVLAGARGDGTLGATAIKEAGGLTIAQELPESDHTPAAALAPAAAIADYVLPADRIGKCVADHARYTGHLHDTHSEEAIRETVTAQLGRIATALRDKTGHDFHGYKPNTFMRRVQRRMQVNQSDTVDEYIDLLRADPDEVQHLFDDLLIGVTQFFRGEREFELLEREVIPRLFEGKGAADSVRLWVLGCATGEEAYSLAILLLERMAELDAAPHVQIFATDIDRRALAVARVGRYSEAAVRDITPERLARWFVREGDTYRVVEEVREMCIFSQHNLIKDAPFSRLDLISCRNLLIYLSRDLQDRAIPLFHFALRRDGYLFLGNSENVRRHDKLFAPIDRRHRIFRKLESLTPTMPNLPLTAADPTPSSRARQALRLNQGMLATQAEQIAERYAPAYVIVDEQFEVLHFAGRTGRFLDPSAGAATLNLLNLVHQDLRLDLRAALHIAATENRSVRLRLEVDDDGKRTSVSMVIEPLDGRGEAPRHFMVLFQDSEIVAPPDDTSLTFSPQLRDEHVQRIETELRLTREQLQATIEELDSTNEELKSANEEYRAINEELRSANEELEASKEGLQSVNEQLQTVNGELAHRVQDLARSNLEIKNLLQSTQIPTLFLDNNLRIHNFTPSATEIFHLIDSDIGRPITHIAGRIDCEELADDVRRVLRTLATTEREVEDSRSGSRYIVRILPYRSIDNFIAGVVLTFLDVTATAAAEKALRESEERFRVMAQTVPDILFISRTDGYWEYVNPRFYEYTGMSEGSGIGTGAIVAFHPEDIEEFDRRWRHSAETGEHFEYAVRLRGSDGSYRWFLTRAEPVERRNGESALWFGSSSDIHEYRMASDRQRMLVSELQHRVKNILAVVRSIFTRSIGEDGLVDAGAEHFRGRLDALARTQNVLARTPAGGIDLEELVRDELTCHGSRYGDQVHIHGPSIRLRQKAAEALGLAVHELATNAAKYGALANETGKIDVTWRLYESSSGPRLAWRWTETGVTLIDPAPSRVGFGRELIEQGLPYQLGASTALEFARGGVNCVIELPLSERIAVFDDGQSAWGDP
jgi:two-component system, chemotaxis family, CheB/CheR fusion protein